MPEYNGADLLHEVHDLLTDRLPRIPLNDPARGPLAVLAPLLARELGHPPVRQAPRPEPDGGNR